MKVRLIAAAIAAVFTLGACGNLPFSKQDQGMVVGGVMGGVVGSTVGGGSGRVLATIAGVLIGGYIGREVGGHMDREDRERHDRAVAETIAGGGRHTWRNPHTHRHGGAVVVREHRSHQGYCREYREWVVINGREVPAYGTACRQPDGSWKIVN